MNFLTETLLLMWISLIFKIDFDSKEFENFYLNDF